MFKKSLVLLFLIFGLNQVYSQLIIDSVDNSKYPKVSFSFYSFSTNNKFDFNLSKENFKIVSSNKDLSIDEFTNPLQNMVESQSIILCFDLALDKNRFQLYKKVANHFIEYLNSDKNEVSVVSFEKYPVIGSYFSNNFSETKKKIDNLSVIQLSDIPQGFTLQPGGAIDVLKQAKYEDKAIVLFTDGNKFFRTDEILLLAKSVGVPIYLVSINKIVSNDVSKLFTETKGNKIDEITIANSKDKALQLFAKVYQYKPVSMSFTNELNCKDTNNVVVTNVINKNTASFEIAVSDTSKPYLDIEPQYLKFGPILPGKSKTLSVTITARRKDIAVSSMTITSDVFKIENYDNGSFVIPMNESKSFDVSYNPKDSAQIFAIMQVHSDACKGKDLFLSAGFPNVKPKHNTIRVTHPNGGEVFVAGDTAQVSWFGVLPNDLIQLMYSSDNMKTWDTIGVNINGLKYPWNVIDKYGDKNRVKIVQLWPNNIGQTLDLRHSDIVYTANFSRSDNEGHVVTTSGNGVVKLFKSYSGAVIREYKIQATDESFVASWANFSHDDKYICASYSDGQVVIWNTNTGSIEKSIKAHQGKVNCVNFGKKSNNLFVSCGYDELIKVWDISKTEPIAVFDNGTKAWFCRFINDDTRILFCDTKGRGKVYDIETKKIIKTFSNPEYIFKANNIEINKDETRVAISQNDAKAAIYDYDTEKLLYTVSHEDTNNLNTVVYYVAFGYHYNNPKQELLITSSSDYSARIWDVKTGKPLKDNPAHILKEHKNSVNMAVFNFDGSRILTASLDSLAKVWNLNKRELQIDTSDNTFTIAKAQLQYDTLRFARTAIEEIRYQEFEKYITNKLDGSFSIYDIFLSGDNEDEFKVLEPFQEFRIKPRESKNISLSFAPKSLGKRTAFLNVVVPRDTIKIPIVGEGYEVGLQVQNYTVDMGQVQLGDFKDTTVVALLKNKSSQKVRVKSIQNSKDNPADFFIMDNIVNTEILPMEEVSVRIRFYANAIGKQSTAFKITTEGENDPLQLLAFAEGIDLNLEKLTLAMKDSEAKIGETVNIPIDFNINNENFNPNDKIEFELQYNPKVLFLQYYPTANIVNDTTALSHLSFTFEELKANKELKFSVGLSVYDSTELAIKNTKIISDFKYSIDTKPGVFYVSDRCVEKAKQTTAKAKFSIYPNPSSSILNIRPIEKLANGAVSISICDANGKELSKFQVSETDLSKNISVDISSYSAGAYFIVLSNGTHKEAIRFNVVK